MTGEIIKSTRDISSVITGECQGMGVKNHELREPAESLKADPGLFHLRKEAFTDEDDQKTISSTSSK